STRFLHDALPIYLSSRVSTLKIFPSITTLRTPSSSSFICVIGAFSSNLRLPYLVRLVGYCLGCCGLGLSGVFSKSSCMLFSCSCCNSCKLSKLFLQLV